MIATRSVYFLMALALTAGVKSAQFAGCSNSAPSPVAATFTSNPYESCNTACAGFAYSFTEVVANAGDGARCACASTNTLSSSSADYDTSVGKMCNVGDYAIQDLDTDYDYVGCYEKTTGIDANWDSMQPDQCFSHCKSILQSYAFTSQTESGSWQCGCADTAPTSPSSSTCGGHNTYTAYYYDVHHPQPSHAPGRKRTLKERAAAKRRELLHELCPGSMVACQVEGLDAYECLDVSSELESCGGCMFGVYTTARSTIPMAATTGSDCSLMPGIPMGAVTCTSGQCTAAACKKGWSLMAGRCVQNDRKVRRVK